MPVRSAPTATTSAPYAGSAQRVEQGLEVGAGARHEHDQARHAPPVNGGRGSGTATD